MTICPVAFHASTPIGTSSSSRPVESVLLLLIGFGLSQQLVDAVQRTMKLLLFVAPARFGKVAHILAIFHRIKEQSDFAH